MKIHAISAAAALALGSSISAPAYGQQELVESCQNQCYQTYITRSNYCINRYGGHGYDAELCMLNEYDVYQECYNSCYTTYGARAGEGFKQAHLKTMRAKCARAANPFLMATVTE